MSTAVSQPGFADPVSDAQACFRAVLDAMARPGQVRRAGSDLTPPAPLAPATGAVLLTLADYDTPLWLDPAALSASEWIAFHCGVTVVEKRSDCSIALALSMLELSSLPAGTHELPESAATLILQVKALGRGTSYRLTGPGLREPALFSVEGLPRGFSASWHENHALFPCGVDLILCAGSTLAALPRSVSVEEV